MISNRFTSSDSSNITFNSNKSIVSSCMMSCDFSMSCKYQYNSNHVIRALSRKEKDLWWCWKLNEILIYVCFVSSSDGKNMSELLSTCSVVFWYAWVIIALPSWCTGSNMQENSRWNFYIAFQCWVSKSTYAVRHSLNEFASILRLCNIMTHELWYKRQFHNAHFDIYAGTLIHQVRMCANAIWNYFRGLRSLEISTYTWVNTR